MFFSLFLLFRLHLLDFFLEDFLQPEVAVTLMVSENLDESVTPELAVILQEVSPQQVASLRDDVLMPHDSDSAIEAGDGEDSVQPVLLRHQD